MRRSIVLILGTCFAIGATSPGSSAQVRQRPVQTRPQVQARPQVRPPAPLPRDRREDVRDRREDVRDRREDVRDRREDVIDRREDVRDARNDGGAGDRREDIRDRREDVIDRREDIVDRREDIRDRLEDRLDHHPAFAERLRALLPPNTPPRDAIAGFKNEGQFIAALHVSQNLNIPFRDLKARLTRDDASLGSAIQDLRPDMPGPAIQDATAKAEAQALEIETLATN